MARCPVCGAAALEALLEAPSVPVFCNVQWDTMSDALAAARGKLDLLACGACGHVHNGAFEASLVAYSPAYDNSQHHSATFRAYASRLVDDLVARYSLREVAVVDIGCGRGDLLAMLADRGENRGFGYDPGHAPGADPPSPRVVISNQWFDAAAARDVRPALVCCRHVLEHVEHPVEFLGGMRESMAAAGRPVLYLEVPSGEQLVRDLAVWDYIYEHYSYFTRASLERALRDAGFEVLAMREDFGGQFLCAEARPRQRADGGGGLVDPPATGSAARARAALGAKLDHWKSWAGRLRASGRSATLWGAGSKGVMFVNQLGLVAPGPLGYAIDQNPNKHRRYLAGGGQVVDGPSRLVGQPVDEVVIMNPIYRDEIARQLEGFGVSPDVVSA